ncbi:hypothetical protein KUL97_01440 [Synechococcus sp. HK05]|uniref:hypothetical protein n=1 Tax=Synechococcus sp. HK05 TaxID=2725975 RepID=UPI001C38C2FD|nr:hypothetical protein [Synechococcus sp. HK05]MBV2350365.1 hypothetical protein [Synechococcus sp. HK05]
MQLMLLDNKAIGPMPRVAPYQRRNQSTIGLGNCHAVGLAQLRMAFNPDTTVFETMNLQIRLIR